MPERITGPQFTEATRADACHAIRDNSPELAPSAPGSAPTATQPAAPGGGCHLSSDKASSPTAVLELRVRNHPGTMSHVTGLFSRRGFNLEAIVCVPVDGGATSCMLLLVANEPRLEQVERQLAKLYDVLTVRHRQDLTREFFARLGAGRQSPAGS